MPFNTSVTTWEKKIKVCVSVCAAVSPVINTGVSLIDLVHGAEESCSPQSGDYGEYGTQLCHPGRQRRETQGGHMGTEFLL